MPIPGYPSGSPDCREMSPLSPIARGLPRATAASGVSWSPAVREGACSVAARAHVRRVRRAARAPRVTCHVQRRPRWECPARVSECRVTVVPVRGSVGLTEWLQRRGGRREAAVVVDARRGGGRRWLCELSRWCTRRYQHGAAEDVSGGGQQRHRHPTAGAR